MTDKQLTFEEAMDRLEKIVSNMENKKLPLEEMMKNYEEGKALSDFCLKQLTQFEGKIEILLKKTEKDVLWKEFEEVKN